MKVNNHLIKKLHRVEKYLGLPLSPTHLSAKEIEKKLKDIRIKYNVII
jgi:hypothetical protein